MSDDLKVTSPQEPAAPSEVGSSTDSALASASPLHQATGHQQDSSKLLLRAKDVTIKFGGLSAVSGFNLELRQGELVGLIGPNGAGKTTVFNLLTGVYQPTSGTIEVCGRSTKKVAPYKLSSWGVARTFQNIRLFKNLSVLENILVAQHQHLSYGMADALLLSAKMTREERQARENAFDLLKIFNLDARADEKSGSLPYGQQRCLEILRALATRPQVLLLDEPAAGMNHSETFDLMNTIAEIRKRYAVSILLIEHDMKLVMGICERIIVLDHGLIICEGEPEHVRQNAKVIEAYLGSSATTTMAVR